MNIALITYGAGVITGMCGVWLFSYVHDLIINFYHQRAYEQELEKEKKLVDSWRKKE